ncbi:flavodoxin family protein [Anaerorhabdus sp.]|uniref:flavodoxin family protein n=1 Tax=Anaerorhabdus sp. TaxID=1872524 RepID=UPI002FC85839
MNALIMNCSPVKDGATAAIVDKVTANLQQRYEVKKSCINDFNIKFCIGCRFCHQTAICRQSDDTEKVMDLFEWAHVIVLVSPSYWADIPGQFKVFIDRCTPWCNTHNPHATISKGKKGYSIALRTGPSVGECHGIIQTIEHFYGHLEIESKASLALCGIEFRKDVLSRENEINKFCEII